MTDLTPTLTSPDPVLTLPAQRNGHRRTGQIARLPKATRARLNEMLQDGVPYLDIIQKLGPDGEGLTEDKLSKWKNGGYMDWLEESRLTAAMRARYEFAADLVSQADDSSQASRAVLQTMAANLCLMLAQTDPAALRDSLLSDADKFSRFVHAMVRLAEGSIKCDEYKTREQEHQAEMAKAAIPPEKPGISDEALAIAENKLRLL